MDKKKLGFLGSLAAALGLMPGVPRGKARRDGVPTYADLGFVPVVTRTCGEVTHRSKRSSHALRRWGR